MVAQPPEPEGRSSPPTATPRLVGILNLTADSFSDGGRYLVPERAIERAHELRAAGADLIDLGPASTRPGATPVPPADEIARLAAVIEPLQTASIPLSIDTYQPETQLWAIERGVAVVNDVQGFPHPEIYPALARATCRLVVMHSVQRLGAATRVTTDAAEVLRGIEDFLAQRIEALVRAGVARDRLILDPGMGFFLGRDPEVSLAVLRRLRRLRERFALPVWVCVSRKSFIGQLTGRRVPERAAGTLAAELYAAAQGVDFLRTHDVAALRDGLAIWRALGASADA